MPWFIITNCWGHEGLMLSKGLALFNKHLNRVMVKYMAICREFSMQLDFYDNYHQHFHILWLAIIIHMCWIVYTCFCFHRLLVLIATITTTIPSHCNDRLIVLFLVSTVYLHYVDPMIMSLLEITVLFYHFVIVNIYEYLPGLFDSTK